MSRGIIVTITLVAALLLILNVVLISCYVRRRNAARKQLHGKTKITNINFCFLFSFFPQGLFVLTSDNHATSSDRSNEFPLVVVLGVTAAATVTLLIVTVVAACVWRHRKKLGVLGQKGGGLIKLGHGCCGRGQSSEKEDEAVPGGSASTSEGKPDH